ncbi:biopolymer transporter ExbD [Helicobacter mesocricetorum]|uniref:biopolymer transporter ExbD n=1 Tax=Helicobacter mesocricetorum TaxID=87012 RepID=UPI000CF0838F|nr:biopolymer transporter ExbD [Helicobacter mesocricetorum]
MKSMKKMDTINVVPFIDIMLVMLVIVLTSATFIAQGKIPINLPQAQGSTEITQNLKNIEITIDEKGKYYLDKNETTLEALETALLEMPKDTAILLRGDSKSYFEKFIALVGMLNKIDRMNVDIEVEQP